MEIREPSNHTDDLETPILQEWVVKIESKPGLKPTCSQVVVVSANSMKMAKNEAVKKVRKGPFKNRSIPMWTFPYCESAHKPE